MTEEVEVWLNINQRVFVYLSTEDGEEREKVKKAEECCKNILNHVNQAVKEAENKQVQTLKHYKFMSVKVKTKNLGFLYI